jgi:hypothetical protein
MIYNLSLCGILIFGVGGFMLIWTAQDTRRPSAITLVAACGLLVIGVALFVAELLVPSGSNAAH